MYTGRNAQKIFDRVLFKLSNFERSTMFQTTQDFVKALKSSSDPPAPGGPTKIEIARTSWDDSSLYAPRKGEVIADWILGVFSKEKDRRWVFIISGHPVTLIKGRFLQ